MILNGTNLIIWRVNPLTRHYLKTSKHQSIKLSEKTSQVQII